MSYDDKYTMQYIVINRGLDKARLSDEAIKWLITHSVVPRDINADRGDPGFLEEYYGVLPIYYSGKPLGLERDDTRLVECIKTLGKRASATGFCRNSYRWSIPETDLVIVGVPKGIKWTIEFTQHEFKGPEAVVEVHRKWE